MGKSAILTVRILGDAKGAQGAFRDTSSGLDNLEAATTRAAKVAAGFGGGMLLAAKAAEDTATANARLATTLMQAGDASGDAAAAARLYADKLEASTGVSDETIKAGQALLATFHAVGGEAGRASGMFDRATAAAVDLSATGIGSVESASVMLGKALQDPIKGVAALGEAGVQFTEEQKAMIAALVESGDVTGAQNIIMKEVEGQVQGTAEATANATDKIRNSAQDMMAVLGGTEETQGALSGLADAAQRLAGWMERNPAAVAALVNVLGAAALAALAAKAAFMAYRAIMVVTTAATAAYTLATNAYALAALAATIRQWALNAAFLANPIGLVVVLVLALVAAFVIAYKKSDAFRNAVNALGSAIRSGFVAAFGAAQRAVSAVVDVLQRAWDLVRKLLNKLPGVNIGGASRAATSRAPGVPSGRAAPVAQQASNSVVVQGLVVDPEGVARVLRAVDRGHRRRAWVPAGL